MINKCFCIILVIVFLSFADKASANQQVSPSDEMCKRIALLKNDIAKLKLNDNPSQQDVLDLKSVESELVSLCELASFGCDCKRNIL